MEVTGVSDSPQPMPDLDSRVAIVTDGGVRGGKAIGASDEIGLRAVEDKVHMHDAHATILSLLGLDHRRLSYLHQGRLQRLTDIGGDNDLAQRLTRA